MSHQSWTAAVLNRLKFFARPLPLIAISSAAILAGLVGEYRRNPDWFGAYNEEDTTASGLDLSGLTTEEQAVGAEIDNLNVLFGELGIRGKGAPNIQAEPGNREETARSLLGDLLALSQPTDNEASENTTSFLTQYLDKYQFSGSRTLNTATADPSGAATSPNTANLLGGSLLGDTSPNATGTQPQPPVSVLEQALQAQAARRNGEQATNTGTSETRSSNTVSQNSSASNDGQTTEENAAGVGVTIPGIPFPVLPTTPQMSPPLGTTGYTPPSSVNLLPPVPRASETTNPFAATSTPNLLPSSAGVPNLPSGSGIPRVSTPQVTGGGYVTPLSPVAPVPTTTVVQPLPAPFSADRPQGNGQINTFSNPSAPVQ